jgi:Pilus formation protein N terminal region
MSLLLYLVRFFRRSVEPGLVICLLFAPAAWALSGDTLVVTVDQARVVKVPATARTLVIGNPMIADVTLLKQGGTMVVTGKGFGETNLIALDSSGNPVAESMVQVVGGGNALVVQRGMDRESYTCAPRCQPTARLGDNPKFYGDVTAQMQAHNAEATGH